MRRTGQLKQMLPRGLEPRTFRLLAERSDQLSYETNLQLSMGLAWLLVLRSVPWV